LRHFEKIPTKALKWCQSCFRFFVSASKLVGVVHVDSSILLHFAPTLQIARHFSHSLCQKTRLIYNRKKKYIDRVPFLGKVFGLELARRLFFLECRFAKVSTEGHS
jgi:hypothetical protein